MSDQDLATYYNEMLARLEEVVYHEVAGTACRKVDLVGTDYIQSRRIEGESAEEVIESCIKEIISMGIATKIDYSIHGYDILLRLEVHGCIHIPKEVKLKEIGVTPYMCPLTNMIGDRILEILNYEAIYMADLDIDENKERCIIKYGIFENVDKIGQVSDWIKI